jgi:hypothetical protein
MGDQVHRQGCDAASIPHRRWHRVGECGSCLRRTVGAACAFGLMLSDLKTSRRSIDDLSAFDRAHRHGSHIRLTVRTGFDRVDDDLIGGRRERQMMPFMSCLPSRLLSAAFVPTAGLLLPGKPIRRRRQMAVVAVFHEPLLQALDLLTQLSNAFFKLGNALDLFSQVRIFLSQPDQFVFCSHALTLPAPACFDTSSGLLSGPE